MRPVTYSMGMSLDGFICGPDGSIDWTPPDEELFAFVTEEVRQVGAYLLGRRLYDTMLYWETAEQDPSLDDARRTWARLWNAIPKVVFSSTLTSVQGNARLATGSLADEVARLRAEPDRSEVAVGGATLAGAAAALGLVDEYRPRVFPVLVGGGTPYFPPDLRQGLDLVGSRTLGSGVVCLRYRVPR